MRVPHDCKHRSVKDDTTQLPHGTGECRARSRICEPTRQGDPVNDRASVGTGGVGSGCTRLWGCSMAPASITPLAEAAASMMGHINFHRNAAGKRCAGKPPATFDEAGTGDVAWLRYGGTRRR